MLTSTDLKLVNRLLAALGVFFGLLALGLAVGLGLGFCSVAARPSASSVSL